MRRRISRLAILSAILAVLLSACDATLQHPADRSPKPPTSKVQELSGPRSCVKAPDTTATRLIAFLCPHGAINADNRARLQGELDAISPGAKVEAVVALPQRRELRVQLLKKAIAKGFIAN